MNPDSSRSPVFSRRAFIAAALSALCAGGAVGLGVMGGVSQPQGQSFQFSRGLSLVDGEDARIREFLAAALIDDRVHVTVLGHTGEAGDADANLALSEERAGLVADIALDLGVPIDRITARGLGGAASLSKVDGESERAFQTRLARVEVSLQVRK